MADDTIRFVVGTSELHSLSWTVRVSPSEGGADVYLMPREISNDYHISLHRSGNWHARVAAAEARDLGYHPDDLKGPTWSRPAELAPGVTLAFRLVVTPAAISRTHQVSKAASCILIPPPGGGRSIEISAAITSGAPSDDSWIGRRSMGTELIGFCRMSRGQYLSLVWREIETPTGSEIKLPMKSARRLLSEVNEEGGVGAMLWTTDADGAPALILGRFDEESGKRFKRIFWSEAGKSQSSSA